MNISRKSRNVLTVLTVFAVILLTLVGSTGCKKEEVTNVTNVINSEDLTNPAIQPKITSTFPVGGSVGPINVYNAGEGSNKAHFVLVFNKLMLKSSALTKAITVQGFNRPVIVNLQSSSSGAIPKSNAVNSGNYDNVLSFVIRDSLRGSRMAYPVGQSCTVTVDSTIEDINGNHLSGRFSFTFTPEPYFRVVSFYPSDGTSDAYISTTPAIVFNSPVDNTIFSSLQIAPDPGGRWKMYSNDSLYVYYAVAGGTLPFNTNFTLTAMSNAKDAANRPIHSQYTSHFSSVAFRVSSTSPYKGQTQIQLYRSIGIDLTGTVDTSTVRGAFSIVPSVAGTFYLSPYNYFTYDPAGTLRQNTTYTVSVSSLLRASDGTPATPYTFTFTTDRFNVSSTYPDDGSINFNRFNSISIYLNGYVDTGSVRSAFSINPSVASGNLSLSDPSNDFNYFHDGLASNTTYVVTISTALRTKAGDHLLSPYSFSFTTQP